MTAEELLKLCHAYLRGAEINDQNGCKQINRDELAKQINLYLNETLLGRTDRQDPVHAEGVRPDDAGRD